MLMKTDTKYAVPGFTQLLFTKITKLVLTGAQLLITVSLSVHLFVYVNQAVHVNLISINEDVGDKKPCYSAHGKEVAFTAYCTRST